MKKRRSILAYLTVLCIVLAVLFFADDNIYTELTFSKDSGFYEEPFELEIYAPPGTDIFYTLDGSNPDENALLYTGPIRIEDATQNDNVYSMRTDMSTEPYTLPDYPIDKCTIINAVYRDAGGNFSNTESKTYFVGYDTKVGYDGLNIISIVTDPDNLFDYDTGIYICGRAYDEYPDKEEKPKKWIASSNFYQRGDAWERAASINIFDTERNLLLSQQCGVRIHGHWNRRYLPKSLNIYAREQYSEQGRFYTDLFNTQYMADTVILSTGGYDALSRVRDVLVSKLTAGRNYVTMNYIPYAMFLDGEYWGVYWMTEKYDDVYIGYYYNTEKENVIMIKNGQLSEGEEADYASYTEMIDYISNTDLSVDSNYQYACELIDIQSFIDYCATEIYIANDDWEPPWNEGLWRNRNAADKVYADGKWRWMLFDVDSALLSGLISTDSFSIVMDNSLMFNNLCQNEDFKKQFTITFMDLVNTSFSTENVDAVISDYVGQMSEPMNTHLRRFFGSSDNSRFLWVVDDIKIFLHNRRPYIVQYLKDNFRLSGVTVPVEIEISDPEAGSIVLNTIEPSFDPNGKWSGEYYTDYPITLTAAANDGYRFVRWEITDSPPTSQKRP